MFRIHNDLQSVANYVVPLKAAITKPEAKAAPERKGARATKKLEQPQSKGHALRHEDATAYRGRSARGSYLSADLPDISFSSKELCREFARANQTSFIELKREATYLKTRGRLVTMSLGYRGRTDGRPYRCPGGC